MINVGKRANRINWKKKYKQLQQKNQELKESFRIKCIESFKTRRSVRQVLDVKPDFKLIENIIEAGTSAPCAGDVQNYKIIVIEDELKRKKIGEFSYHQFWINKAPYILVILREDKELKKKYPDNGELYSMQNVAVVIQNIMMAIHMSKLATCWIAVKNDDGIRKMLEIPDEYHIDAVIPIGYPNEVPFLEKRAETMALIDFKTLGNKVR